MSLEINLKKAKQAFKANKTNADLKNAYEAAKAALVAGAKPAVAAPVTAPVTKEKKRKQGQEDTPSKKTKTKPTLSLEELSAAVKAAKKALKADKANTILKANLDNAVAEHAKALLVPKVAAIEEDSDDDSDDEKKPVPAKVEAKEESSDEEEEEEPAKPAKKEEKPDISALENLKKNKNAKKEGHGPKDQQRGQVSNNPPCEKVICKNLSYEIDDDKIKAAFADIGGEIKDIYWLTDRETGKFRGAGFITFDSLETSAKAVAKSGTDVLGRAINVEYATPRAGGAGPQARGPKKGGHEVRPPGEKPPGCTGVFIGNLAFDIDDDKLREFAKDCGEIRNIRWVMNRETGEFKGCGFVDFDSEDAVDKMIALNGTDCSGRAIRVDYAKPRE